MERCQAALDKSVLKASNLQAALDQAKADSAAASLALETARANYATALRELASTVQPQPWPQPQQPVKPTLSLEQLMDGSLEGVQLDDGGHFGLEDVGWEPSQEEREEAARRKEQLASAFKEAAVQAFGVFREQARSAVAQQKGLEARLAAKKRRADEGSAAG
eukprot:2324362-Pyramimonas_sp.AAC.1